MFASAYPSSLPGIPAYVRARAEVRGVFARAGQATKLIDRYETDGLRVRLPNSGERCEAVVLNTAGGLAGGDAARLSFALGSETSVCITTQSAEKIYRADDTPAVIAANVDVGDGADLVWMPQETILFDGSGLVRSLNVDMAANASLIAVESTVFGRVARGEELRTGSFHDRWRVRRGGSLIFADDVRLDGPMSKIIDGLAVGHGARAVATLLCVSSEAEEMLPSVRDIIDAAALDGGASAWNGMLVARLAGRNPLEVRNSVGSILRLLSRNPLPRVWSI